MATEMHLHTNRRSTVRKTIQLTNEQVAFLDENAYSNIHDFELEFEYTDYAKSIGIARSIDYRHIDSAIKMMTKMYKGRFGTKS